MYEGLQDLSHSFQQKEMDLDIQVFDLEVTFAIINDVGFRTQQKRYFYLKFADSSLEEPKNFKAKNQVLDFDYYILQKLRFIHILWDTFPDRVRECSKKFNKFFLAHLLVKPYHFKSKGLFLNDFFKVFQLKIFSKCTCSFSFIS